MSQINDKLKKIIFNKLNKDLSHAEIILHDDDSIWFIDRDEKYWYLEFEKSGKLWWRPQFFANFFQLFSLDQYEFKPIIAEWVEEVLNRRVDSTKPVFFYPDGTVEEVLNRRVDSTKGMEILNTSKVEEVLNRRVVSARPICDPPDEILRDVLNQNNTTTYT